MSNIDHTYRTDPRGRGAERSEARRSDPGALLVNIPEIYRIVWPWRTWIAMAMLLTMAAAVVAYVAMTPKYESSVALLIDPSRLQVVDRDLRSAERVNADDAIVDTQMRVITTDSVLKRVVERLELASDPEFVEQRGLVNALKGFVKRVVGVQGRAEPAERLALRHLRQIVDTLRVGNSYVIEIYVRTESIEKSAAVASAIAQAYLDGEFEASVSAATRAAESLSMGLDELRAAVVEAENAVAAYKAENDIAGADGRLVSEQQLSELNVQLVQAQVATENARARLDQWQRLAASGASVDELSEAIGSGTIAQLRGQLAVAQQGYSQALQVYGDRHPSLRPLAGQVEAIRRSIRDELDRIAGGARNAYDRAVAHEASLRGQLEAIKQDNFETGFAQVRLRELERELETRRTVYQSYLLRAQEVSEQKEVNVSNARIVTSATIPARSTKPSLLFVLALAAAMGLALSAGAIIVRDQMRRGEG